MIIIAAIALVGQPVAQTAPSVADEDIVVIGQRLRKIRFKMKRDSRTKLGSCRITRSGGDPILDAMVCRAAVACMGTKKVKAAAWNACMNVRMKTVAQERREQRRRAGDRISFNGRIG